MTKQTDKQSIYEKITEQMIKMLDEGVAPWRKPWMTVGLQPTSLSTNKQYRGINWLTLFFTADAMGYASPYWGTYKQIGELGGQVRKGEKGTTVMLWSRIKDEKRLDADGNATERWFARGFTVFNSEQADWEEGKAPVVPTLEERSEIDVLADAERIVERYLNDNGPSLKFGGDRAFYRPSEDSVTMPERKQFNGTAEYYSTLFHEFGHSTGHKSRLDREGVTTVHAFGDEVYSREELVAEFAAAFCCGHVGVLPTTLDNSAAYIANWKKALREDTQAVVWAAGKAQKAADMILGNAATDETESAAE